MPRYSPGLGHAASKETRAWVPREIRRRQARQVTRATHARYISGLRNGEGFAFDDAGRLFATMHGRDQLFQNWPRLYTAQQSAELPAEELVQLVQGADYGWPECYYDQIQNKLVLRRSMAATAARRWGSAPAPVAAFRALEAERPSHLPLL